jgi:hypothetical protein
MRTNPTCMRIARTHPAPTLGTGPDDVEVVLHPEDADQSKSSFLGRNSVIISNVKPKALSAAIIQHPK